MLTNMVVNPDILKFGCILVELLGTLHCCWMLVRRKKKKKKEITPVGISRSISLEEKRVDHIDMVFVLF